MDTTRANGHVIGAILTGLFIFLGQIGSISPSERKIPRAKAI